MSSSKLSNKPQHLPNVPKKIYNKNNSTEDQDIEVVEDEEEEEGDENLGGIGRMVSTHLYLKPAHSTGTLDREVVLRRIRHRKRFNRVKTAMKTLLTSPFIDSKATVTDKRWVDDAFSAP